MPTIPRATGQQDITRIRPATWNRVADSLNGGAIGASGLDGGGINGNWVMVKNTSGSDRLRWDCMQLGDPVMTLDLNGQVDLVFNALTAAADKTPCILLEPIANGRTGRAVIHGLALARVAAGTITKLSAEPDGTAHNLKPVDSGPIRLLTAPNASAIKLLPVMLGAGATSGMLLIQTPSGGIPAATGSGPYTWGSATCTIVNDDGTVGSDTEVVKNIVNQAIAGSVSGKAVKVGSIYVVDVASCGA